MDPDYYDKLMKEVINARSEIIGIEEREKRVRTMKKILIILIFIALSVVGYYTLKPKPAQCFGCYTGTCYSSSICGSGCVCLKQGISISGQCYSQ